VSILKKGTWLAVIDFISPLVELNDLVLAPVSRFTTIVAVGIICSRARRHHLTESIYELVSESHPPHKIVNLLFTFTN